MDNKPIKLGTTKLWTLVASACYWAWFDAATFRPTLLAPFDSTPSHFNLYFIITMLSGAVVLLAVALLDKKAIPFIRLRPYGLIVTFVAVISNLLTLFGAYLQNPILIIISAIFTGSSCSFFLLEWARIYSRQGAKSSSVLISSAIALGVLIDLLITGMATVYAALFTSALPLLAMGIYAYMDSLMRANNLDVYEKPEPQETRNHLSMEEIFFTSGTKVFDMSISFIVALFIFGLSFGFMQYNTVFSLAKLSPAASDILLIARGCTAGLIFLATYFFPRKVYTIYRIGLLVMIGGFLIKPFLSIFASSNLISGFIIMIGYTTFDIITWTLLAEIAYTTNESAIRTFGSGRFFIHFAIVVGFLFALIVPLIPASAELLREATTTVGYLLVIAEMLLLNENSALWMLFRFGSLPYQNIHNSEDSDINLGASESLHEKLCRQSKAHGLTQREIEILHLLITGRSTPRIAHELMISDNTVNSHIRHIYGKLDVHSKQELIDMFHNE